MRNVNLSVSHSGHVDRFNQLAEFAQMVYDANPHNPPLQIMNIRDPEVRQLLEGLAKYEVRYMLVGGVATVFHGHVRTTQDLDLWVQEGPDNRKRLVFALQSVGVPDAERYETVEMIPGWSTITIGQKGFVADFMSYTKAFSKEDFEACYQRAERAVIAGIPISVIYIDDLIKEKKSLGRSKDQDDVEHLKQIAANRRKRL